MKISILGLKQVSTFILIFLLFSVPSQTLATSWICKTQATVGFEWGNDQGKYRPTFFSSDEDYLIRPWKEEDGRDYTDLGQPTFVIVELGSNDPIAYFFGDLTDTEYTKSLIGAFEVGFFGNTNEFSISTVFPLTITKENRTANPFMALGACSKL